MEPWNHLHPLIVHFPIGLLAAVPGVVLFGLFWPAQRRGIHATALALLVLGTLAAGLALVTGEAGAALAQRTPELRATLLRHEAQAQGASLLFLVLTVLFALLQGNAWRNPARTRQASLLCALWLALALFGLVQLAGAAHWGGVMVHHLALHATPTRETP